ncbi:MAG: ABC transporter ATP-binding protein [Conexivisphaerales archaeon]
MNLYVYDKEFFILLGASGSGKSTTLNIIAGLEKPTAGDILIDNVNVNELSPAKRRIAMVFQDYALYPHMTVFNNLAFPLKVRHNTKDYINEKVKEVANMLDLTNLLGRYPRELSGGQAQRVALGRALVRDPSVFLLDEPLSNLDAKIRSQIRIELKMIQKTIGKTFIYVTHDQQEAMSLGTHIGILHRGKIVQYGEPMEVYKKPVNEYVAAFLGEPAINFFELNKVEGKFTNSDITIDSVRSDSKTITLGIRPENFSFTKHQETDYVLHLTPKTVEILGPYMVIVANTRSGKEVRIRIEENSTINPTKEFTVYCSRSDGLIFDENGTRIDA